MAKIVLTDQTNTYNATSINEQLSRIEAEFQDKVLYRNNPVGESNVMESSLDMNSKRVLNLPEPLTDNEAARLVDVRNATAGAAANLISFTPGATLAGTNVQAALTEAAADAEANRVALAASSGASLVGWIRNAVGAVSTTLNKLLGWREFTVFEFMTAAEIADVQGYTFGIDVTAKVQAAWNAAHAAKCNCFNPAGGYLHTGLVVPGTVDGAGTDDRGKGIRIYGQATGEPFVHTNTGGTVFKSVTDAVSLTDILGTAASSNGTVEIDHIRWDGTTTTVPVVKLQSFYGLSSFHHNVIYQRGNGDGFEAGWGATVEVHNNYCMNADFATFGIGAARTGTGFKWVPTADNGLVAFRKNTSRGWLTAYVLGGGAGAAYSGSIEKCESSVVYNGIILNANADKSVISGCYFESGDGGIGIQNLGDYNTIENNLIFPGFAKAIEDTGTANKGSLIQGNLISSGAKVNGIGVDITSSAAAGGNSKNVINNTIVYTSGTEGVNGIKLSGTAPRVNIMGNAFDPKEAWTGAGTVKINDASSAGTFGFTTKTNGAHEIPTISNGAIALFRGAPALTQADVAANVLTIPEAGSYFVVSATAAATVNSLNVGTTAGRFIILRATTANMTFADTANIFLNGAFTGPGTLTLFVDISGANTFAYEVSRTVF